MQKNAALIVVDVQTDVDIISISKYRERIPSIIIRRIITPVPSGVIRAVIGRPE